MLLKKYQTNFIEKLSSLYDKHEIESFFYIILEFLHQKKRIDLALQPIFEITDGEIQKWDKILKELINQKPIQYILGETYFYDLKFYVDENTLIPRPETEELVELIIKNVKKSNTEKLKILDIGTGSGCIAISLAKNLPNAEVYALDVSEKALEIARKNAEFHNVTIHFIKENILEIDDLVELVTRNSQLTTHFDIIVSNPPYVRILEKMEIKKNVLEFEPHLALFVEDNDALLFYRKISALAQKNLSETGTLYFEINQYLGKETHELVESFGFINVEVLKDIYGNDRMVVAIKS